MVGVDCFDVPRFTTRYCSCQSHSPLQSILKIPDHLSQTYLLPRGFEPAGRVNAHGL
jgi:hypothetical protein